MCRTNRARPTDEAAGDDAFAAKLTALATMPARLAEIIAGIASAHWKTRAKDGNFSLQEHACHLRDIEIEAYRARLERMLAETRPGLADVNGAELARVRDYHRQDLVTAQAVFTAVRTDMVHRLANLSPEQRRRTGVLDGIGEIAVESLVAKMLEHDAEHLTDLAQLQQELAV
ncbi:MAG TPA: DinB family protein [Stellaceae bacterium]|nr:DinB family protein [Stellaceae bacterium]